MSRRFPKNIFVFILVAILTLSAILLLSTITRVNNNLNNSNSYTAATEMNEDDDSAKVSAAVNNEEKSNVPFVISILAFAAILISILMASLLIYKRKVNNPDEAYSKTKRNPKSEVTFRSYCFGSKVK